MIVFVIVIVVMLLLAGKVFFCAKKGFLVVQFRIQKIIKRVLFHWVSFVLRIEAMIMYCKLMQCRLKRDFFIETHRGPSLGTTVVS